MKQGRVKWFSNVKGYGFITYRDKEYFVHYTSIDMHGYKTLTAGDLVYFESDISEKGHYVKRVVVLDE